MKNNRGQALVEFVIILPIFIFMIFSCLDLGRILYYKNNMESKMDEAITSYESGKNKDEITKVIGSDFTLEINEDSKYVNFLIKKEVDIITPGLNLILGSPYYVTSKRVIYSE